METRELATKIFELCKAGKDHECLEFYADDAVSIEAEAGAPGMPQEFKGKGAIQEKQQWWYKHHELHEAKVEGPYVHSDRFALHFYMDITNKEAGKRVQMSEVGLYTTAGGKVIKEEFFY